MLKYINKNIENGVNITKCFNIKNRRKLELKKVSFLYKIYFTTSLLKIPNLSKFKPIILQTQPCTKIIRNSSPTYIIHLYLYTIPSVILHNTQVGETPRRTLKETGLIPEKEVYARLQTRKAREALADRYDKERERENTWRESHWAFDCEEYL